MNKTILYFVIGGHGGQVNVDLWRNKSIKHKVVVTCVDWGETSGLMGRICEMYGIKFLPMGDLRNNIGNILEAQSKKFRNLIELLQSEVSVEYLEDDLNKLIAEIKNNLCPDLKKYINLEDLNEFLIIYLGGFKEIAYVDKIRVKDGKEVLMGQKPGNILLEGIYYSLVKQGLKNPLHEFAKIIQQLHLVPENFEVYFVEKERKTLGIIDHETDYILEGEDKIDNHKDEIRLSNFVVTDPKNGKIFKDKDPDIIDLINEANVIIIPPGSEGNTYPWLTHYVDELKAKTLWRVVNIIKENNSSGIAHEMAYLDSLGLNVYYLFPNDIDELLEEIDINRLVSIMGTYLFLENKVPQFFDYDQEKPKFPGLKVLKRLLQEEGLEQKKIAELLNRVIPIMEISAFDGRSLKEIDYQSSDQILKLGLRHVPNQMEQIGIYLAEASEKPGSEVAEELRQRKYKKEIAKEARIPEVIFSK